LERTWRDSWFWPEHLEKYLLRRSVASAASEAFGDLLDVGCGSRPYQSLFTPHINTYIGVDYPPSTSSLSTANVFADAQRLPFAGRSFDTILCTQVLEHVPWPWEAVQELARVLRPGGIAIVTVPQDWGIHREPYDFYRYTRYGIAVLVQKAGLNLERIERRGGFWAAWGQMLTVHFFNQYVHRFQRDRQKGRYVTSALIVAALSALVQPLAYIMDRLLPNERNTLGYLFLARKPVRKEAACQIE
jgi:SAM-dependent methyltransferase